MEKKCTHCHKCQETCLFLKKYKIDIGDTERLEELAYHCFLCGKCTEMCPEHIDGREIILNIRRAQVAGNGGKLKEKGYQMLVQEKRNYIFQNYSGAAHMVLFPGCNFPSYFPETTRYLADLLGEAAGIGMVFDCCGKPIAELGLAEDEKKCIEQMEKRMTEKDIEELVMVCPNCYAFLKPRLTSVRIVTIYEKLAELGLGNKIDEKLTVFQPCPDRASGEILDQIRPFLSEEPELLSGAQCCGLGGCAGGKESDLAEEMGRQIQKESRDICEKRSEAGGNGQEKICTYCASCSGSLARKGITDTEHLLLKILGRTESPDASRSLVNRMKTKYWKGKKYGR